MPKWSGQTGGTRGMQRALVVLFRHLDVRVIYAVMSIWLLFYMVTRPKATAAVYRYHRQIRHLQPLRACLACYRSYYNFGEVIMDRFATYGGKQFHITLENGELFEQRKNKQEGFFVFFSHVGNSEMAGYVLATPQKRMHIMSYAGETDTVMENRRNALERNNIGMILVGDDMGHVFEVNNAISNGDIVAMAADRSIHSKALSVNFMGAEAEFPAGPFQLAVTMRKPVIQLFVLKEQWDSYRVVLRELKVNGQLQRQEQVMDLALQYVKGLENVVRDYPYQWFNFYDFWTND